MSDNRNISSTLRGEGSGIPFRKLERENQPKRKVKTLIWLLCYVSAITVKVLLTASSTHFIYNSTVFHGILGALSTSEIHGAHPKFCGRQCFLKSVSVIIRPKPFNITSAVEKCIPQSWRPKLMGVDAQSWPSIRADINNRPWRGF